MSVPAVPFTLPAPPALTGFDDLDDPALVEWFRRTVRECRAIAWTGVLHPEVRFEAGFTRHATATTVNRFEGSQRRRRNEGPPKAE